MTVRSYRVNEPAVVYEVFDGEVVIVNLDNGNYYSLETGAAELWNDLVRGESQTELIEGAQRRYAGAPSEVAAAIEKFLAELQDEGLIEPQENAASSDAPKEATPNVASDAASDVAANVTTDSTVSASGSLPAFEPPILNRFTDMQELLLLDPIHQVDESGWPHVKASEA